MTTRPGTLYLVGTPIGNLEDITLRALRVLAEVDLIAAEDTRVTRVLLQRYKIKTPLLSYHEHSGPEKLAKILTTLKEGKQVALVSDAGMPSISDPGAKLVQECVKSLIPIVVVPGPTAVESALALSGFAVREFMFLGFLPKYSGPRKQALERVKQYLGTVICFESPHRILKSLDDMIGVLGDREAVCARELTKKFEEVIRGRLSDLIAHFTAQEPIGEMTIVISGTPAGIEEVNWEEALTEVLELAEAGLGLSRAVAYIARKQGLSRSRLYQEAVSLFRSSK